MTNPLKAMIQMGVVPAVTFPTDSRYYASKTLSYNAPNGQPITYLARRFVPQPGAQNFATIATHTVKQGDRLDLLAAKYLGDPLTYWLICDANGAIRNKAGYGHRVVEGGEKYAKRFELDDDEAETTSLGDMTKELLQCFQTASGSAQTHDGEGTTGLAYRRRARFALGPTNRNRPLLLLSLTLSFLFHGL